MDPKKGKLYNFTHSLRFKIALVFTLITMITLGITGWVFLNQFKTQSINNLRDQVEITRVTRTKLATDLNADDTERQSAAVATTLSGLTGITDEDSIFVIDENGIIRGATEVGFKQNSSRSYRSVIKDPKLKKSIDDSLQKGETFNQKKEFQNNGKRYLAYIAPLMTQLDDHETINGAVIYLGSLENTYARIDNIRSLFILSLTIPFIGAEIISYFTSRWLSRPIEILSKQANTLASGDYSESNQVKSNDEIGKLATSINKLSRSINEETELSKLERNRLDSLLSNMTDGVLSIDRQGVITVANTTAGDILNINADNLAGKNIIEILGFKENGYTLRSVLQNFSGIILHDVPNTDSIIRVTSSLVRRQSGYITGSVLVLRDVTNEVKLENQQKDFVSNVSHELRTPLTSVNSYIETLQDGAITQRKLAREFLEVAHVETQRMIRMINDLLELSRIDQKTLRLEKEYINVYKFMNHILNRFNVIVDTNEDSKKRYSFTKLFKNKDTYVEVDPDRLTQVMDNLINNAIKYSPDGSEISINIVETSSTVKISITDQGIGIPKKDVKNIFNRFYRVDKARARKQGGSGLGLAISKEVVEALNGKIWAESKEGKGTTMFVELPIANEENEF